MDKMLPIQIPLDYAEGLGIHRSHLTHVNRGRKHLSSVTALRLLELSSKDPRLRGLTINMLRPEASAYEKYYKKLLKKLMRRVKKGRCSVPRCPILNNLNL